MVSMTLTVRLPSELKHRLGMLAERTRRTKSFLIGYIALDNPAAAHALGDEPKGHETVTILRVIHGARDWPEVKRPE